MLFGSCFPLLVFIYDRDYMIQILTICFKFFFMHLTTERLGWVSSVTFISWNTRTSLYIGVLFQEPRRQGFSCRNLADRGSLPGTLQKGVLFQEPRRQGFSSRNLKDKDSLPGTHLSAGDHRDFIVICDLLCEVRGLNP